MAAYRRLGKAQATIAVLRDLVRAYPDEMGLRAYAAAAYAAQGLLAPAVEEYTMLSRIQIRAGLLDDACRSVERILELEPEQPEEYRRLLDQLQCHGSS